MTFNMARVGEDKCVQVIKDYLVSRFGKNVVYPEAPSESNLFTFSKNA